MEKGHYVQLKPNVWKWQVGPHAYSIKKYDYPADVDKIRFIHDQLARVGADYIIPIEDNSEPLVIQQPWIDSGRKVQFSNSGDRKESLALLHNLHDSQKLINWQESKLFQEMNILRKWAHRLDKWRQYEPFLFQKLGVSKTQKITQIATDSLARLKPMSHANVTLLHGDVVHHNFVRDKKSNKLFIIDFDLACIGPPEVELILWAHRVLPHFDYDVEELLGEHPTLRNIDLNYLLFPNELMREWLYASTLPDHQLRVFLPKLKTFTDKALKLAPVSWDDHGRMN